MSQPAMPSRLGRQHRLASRGSPGLSWDDEGLALGCVALVISQFGHSGRWRYVVRPAADVAKALRLAYGSEPEAVLDRYHRGLQRVFDLFETGDSGRAGVQAVLLGLPDIAPEGMAKLAAAEDLMKGGEAWRDEPRVPAGQTGAGDWTSDGGTSSPNGTPAHELDPHEPAASQSEVNLQSVEEIANRDYHDEVVAKVARIARRLGCRVVTEIPLVGFNGVVARADLLILTPPGELVLIEVKTGAQPKYEYSQRIIYPMASIGWHVYSPDPRIAELGFKPMERLPPMGFETFYKKDKRSRLQLEKRDDPFKLLDE